MFIDLNKKNGKDYLRLVNAVGLKANKYKEIAYLQGKTETMRAPS